MIRGKRNVSSANSIPYSWERKREEFCMAKDQRFLGSEELVEEVQERLGERGWFKAPKCLLLVHIYKNSICWTAATRETMVFFCKSNI